MYKQTTWGEINAVLTAGGTTKWLQTQRLGSGFAAVLFWINNEHEDGMPSFGEPYDTGIGRYATREEAYAELQQWARDEELAYIADE